jgi:predicted GNAT family acetyltransferase
VAANLLLVEDDHAAAVRRMIEHGQLFVWDDAGDIVSCAAIGRRTPHGAAVTMVYTPPEHRSCGYATSCVAELTRARLAAGDEFCCLYTDLANPISNAIYARIGYRRICDSAWWSIQTEAAPGTAISNGKPSI